MFAIDIPFYRTAKSRGKSLPARISRVAAKESFAATRLRRLSISNHGLQPWLQSVAATRLNPAQPNFLDIRMSEFSLHPFGCHLCDDPPPW